jgi:hypothetical protein
MIERACKRGTGVLLVLLLFGSAASSIARAGCGYGVSSKDSRWLESTLHDMTFVEYSVVAPEDRSTPRNSEHKPPCAGPGCSRPYGSPQAPAPALSVRDEPGLLADITVQTTCPETSTRWEDPLVPRPRLHTSPLERPPKRCS